MKKAVRSLSFAGIFFLLILAVPISFYCGVAYAGKDIRVYEDGGYTETYPKTWPTYNLPIAEFTIIIKALEQKDYEQATKYAEYYLDLARRKAERRLLFASESEKEIIQKSIDAGYKPQLDEKQQTMKSETSSTREMEQ
jgi:hypothetical protein